MAESIDRRSEGQRKRWADVPEDERRAYMRAATDAGVVANVARSSHADCTHPRTKAARLRCKRARARKAAQS